MILKKFTRMLHLIKLKFKYDNDIVEYAIEVHENIESFAKRFGKIYFIETGHYLVGVHKAESFNKAVRVRYMAKTGCYPSESLISNLCEGVWLYKNWPDKVRQKK